MKTIKNILVDRVYPIFKYNDIENLINSYKNEKTTVEVVVDEALKYLNDTKDLNYIIDVKENNFDAFIVRQLVRLNHLRDENENVFEKYPLWGIPVIVKDNVDIENMATTSGASYFLNNIAKTNCKSVDTLINLGAIIIAKSNLSEFSGMSAQYGYSELGNKTINPINRAWDTSGSSSGSSVAASLGFPLTIGTETFGSILFPSISNSAYGWKPEQSLLTDYNGVPISHKYDTVGIISNSYNNMKYIQNILGFENKQQVKKIVVEHEIARDFFYLGHWNSEIDVNTNFIEKLKKLLKSYDYEIIEQKTDLVEFSEIFANADKCICSDQISDFVKFDSEEKYDLFNYINSREKNPNYIDVIKKSALLDKEDYDEYIEDNQLIFEENYFDADVVIGCGAIGTYLSATNQFPAQNIPFGLVNDKIFGASLVAKNTDYLMEIVEIINKNIDWFID